MHINYCSEVLKLGKISFELVYKEMPLFLNNQQKQPLDPLMQDALSLMVGVGSWCLHIAYCTQFIMHQTSHITQNTITEIYCF